MPFPTGPVNGQIYTDPNGKTFIYSSANLTWDYDGKPTSSNKSNNSATIAPTITDDSTLGYAIGSLWIVSGTQESYICMNPAAGGAVWKPIEESVNNISAIVAPGVLDNYSSGYRVGSVWYNTLSNEVYICTVPSVPTWVKISQIPAYFTASIPKNTIVPMIATTIPFVAIAFNAITSLAGVMTVSQSGLYTIDFIGYFEGSNKRFIYNPTLWINGIVDLIDGTMTTQKDNSGARWPSFGFVRKTVSLLAGDTVEIKHITDDATGTYSANLSIVRNW